MESLIRTAEVNAHTAPLRVGLIGAGMIASFDWGILPGSAFLGDRASIRAIAPSRVHSEKLAAEYGIPAVYDSLEQLLAADDIDAVVNITPIPLHAATSRRILLAGKHLVSEKPLASTLAEADELIGLARDRNLLIVCSPPRMLDPSRALARELVTSGAIGPLAFARVRSSHAGPAWQAWPADPSWFYGADAGPLLDMGPYGIQEITGILGPARAVTAVSGRTSLERTVAGGPFDGRIVEVSSDDNVILILHFDDAAFAVVDCTFNVRAARSPEVEIFGHAGTINLSNARLDPDRPEVELYRVNEDGHTGSWHDVTDQAFKDRATHVRDLRRAVLIEHLLDCLGSGEPPILSAEHARHTLDIMLAAQRSAATGSRIELTTTFDER